MPTYLHAGYFVYLLGLLGFITALIDYRHTPLGCLITTGLYRYSRNPQVASVLLTFFGVSFAMGLWAAVALLIVACPLLHTRIVAEERSCLQQYGASNKAYMNEAPSPLALGMLYWDQEWYIMSRRVGGIGEAMFELDALDWLFVGWAFFFQLALIVHFAIRKWRFDLIQRYGWLTYALALPAGLVSLILLRGGRPWWLWVSGFLCLIWAAFGFSVEYLLHLEWRNAESPRILAYYLFLYLTMIMFYWWPLDRFGRMLWIAYTVLFVISTILNLASHKHSQAQVQSESV